MKKLLKIGLIGFGVLAVLLAGAVVLLKVKYPPEKIKAIVLEQVRARLHREAEVGEVSIGLFKGIELSNFKLSERPDFSKGSFVECGSFRLGFSLLTILQGKLTLSQVVLESPRIQVVREADGKTFNFSDMMTGGDDSSRRSSEGAKSEASDSGAKAGGAAAALLVESVRIRGGEVRFVDKAPQGYDVGLRNLNLSVDGFSLLKPFKVGAGVDADLRQKGKSLPARVELAAQVSIAGGGRAEVEKLSVTSGKTALELSGTVEPVLGVPKGDLRIQLKSFDPATAAFFAELPPLAKTLGLSADLRVKGGQESVEGEGVMNLDVAGLKGTIRMSDLSFRQGKEPYFRLVAALENVQPSQALPVEGVKVSGSLTGKVKVEGTPSRLTAWADVDGSALDLKYADLVSKAAGIPLRLRFGAEVEDQDAADLKEFQAVFGPVNLSVSGAVSGIRKGPRLNLKAELSPLVLGELSGMVGPLAPYKAQGSVSASLRITGTADSPAAEGTVELKGLSAEAMPGIPVSGVSGTLRLKPDAVHMPALSGRLMESPFKIALAIENFKAPRVKLEGSLDKLDMGRVLAALPKDGKKAPVPPIPPPPQAAKAVKEQGPLMPFGLKADLSVAEITHPNYEGRSLKAQADLSGRGADLSALKGTAGFSLGEGMIHDIPLVSSLATVIDPTLSRLRYDSIIARMTFEDGKMRLAQGDLNGQMSVSAAGTYAFENDGLDFSVKVKIPRDKVHPVIAQYASVGQNVVPLDLGLGGTLARPKYSLKVTEMVKEKAKDEIKQKAGEILEKQLKNILKF